MAVGKTVAKWASIALGVLLVAGAVFFFFFLAGIADGRMNQTLSGGPYPVSDEARALHATLRVADLHSDSLLWDRDLLVRHDRGHMDVPRLIEGNVALQVFTAVTKTPRGQNIDANTADSDNITLLAMGNRWPLATWTSIHERAIHQARKLHEFADASEGRLTVVTNQAELASFLDERGGNPAMIAGILGLEGAQPLEGQIENLGRLFEAGHRTLGLVHFFDNEVGGSAHGVRKGGLTEFGREVVRHAEAYGMIIDLAHASPTLIDEVLDMATRPVIVSHGGVKGTCDNVRNLSDEHILRIAEGGGLIGIGYWETAVCDATPAGIARAIRYTADLAGVGHVALGSDYDGVIAPPFDTADLAVLTHALLEEGLDEQAIRQVMGENIIAFMAKNLPEY